MEIPRKSIEAVKASTVSLMPEKLLSPLNEQEVLDLLAYVLSRGDATDAMFRPTLNRTADATEQFRQMDAIVKRLAAVDPADLAAQVRLARTQVPIAQIVSLEAAVSDDSQVCCRHQRLCIFNSDISRTSQVFIDRRSRQRVTMSSSLFPQLVPRHAVIVERFQDSLAYWAWRPPRQLAVRIATPLRLGPVTFRNIVCPDSTAHRPSEASQVSLL